VGNRHTHVGSQWFDKPLTAKVQARNKAGSVCPQTAEEMDRMLDGFVALESAVRGQLAASGYW
jgi:hypothetical protein